jgi:hypothetical protein
MLSERDKKERETRVVEQEKRIGLSNSSLQLLKTAHGFGKCIPSYRLTFFLALLPPVFDFKLEPKKKLLVFLCSRVLKE